MPPAFTTRKEVLPPGCYFDREAVERFLSFAAHLHQFQGKWADKPLEILPWELEEIVAPLFGTMRADGTRFFRTVFVFVPRKNGKTTLLSAIELYLLLADGESGAQVVTAAVDRAQATFAFEPAKMMVNKSPGLRARAKVYRREIRVPATGSTFWPLSSDLGNKHGMNLHAAGIDELHAWPNRELLDIITSSMGARTQPVTFIITTAGYDPNSAERQLYDHTIAVSKGLVSDPSFLGVIYEAPADMDWTSAEAWRVANPSLGVTITEEFLAAECERAKAIPSMQNAFRRLYLNQHTSQDTRWMSLEAWDGCTGNAEVPPGSDVYAGLDLSSTTDLTALVLLAPQSGMPVALPFFFLPEEGLRERGLRDRVPYEVWQRDGHLLTTPGNVVDYSFIRAKVRELAKTYRIRELVYDRWGATQLVQEFQEDGLTVVPMGQGFASMSAPTKELMRLVLDKKLVHGGHPVLRWNADNAAVQTDPAGNIKLAKDKSTGRIDGLVALVMALDAVMRRPTKKSIYEDESVTAVI
jgi:phage terminase large subunit-like protein